MGNKNSGRRPVPIEERFWPKVQKGPGCWVWGGSISASGYGTIGENRKVRGAHRVAWELINGPIPPNSVVRHSCDNPVCVNPAHLLLGTAADNAQDKMQRGRWRGHNISGDVHWNTKIRVASFPDIFTRRANGQSMRGIARDYGVSHAAIQKILNGARSA